MTANRKSPECDASPGPRSRMTAGLGLLAAFALVAAAGLWSVLRHPDQVLDFNDGNIESALSPAYATPGALVRVWDNQFFFGLGGKQFALGSASLGETLLGPHHYRREGVVLILALAAGALYWMLRQYRFPRTAAALSAGALAFSGGCFTFAALGLTVRAAGLGFAALAAGFVERGRRQDAWLPYALGGGCLGLSIAEAPDIGVFLAVSTAGLLIWTHWPVRPSGARWARLAGRFGLYVAASVALAWQTLGVMVSTQVEGVQQGSAEDPAARYAWATQWSLPPEETWNLVSGTYFGTTARSQDAPYHGRLGRSPDWETTRQGFRNFSLTGYHLGVVPSILLLSSLLLLRGAPPDRRRLAWAATAGAGLSLLLAWGKFTPAYRLLYALPHFGAIRNPEKWMMPFLLFAAPALAAGIEALRRYCGRGADESGGWDTGRVRRALFTACAAIGGLALLLLITTAAGKSGFVGRLDIEGYGEASAVAWATALMSCLKTAGIACAIAALIAGAPLMTRLSARLRCGLVLGALALLGFADLASVNAHFVAGKTYRHALDPNPLGAFIGEHRSDGRFKMLPPEHPALNMLRMSHMQVSGCDLFDPVSVSRMPDAYGTLLDALAEHPIRLWELGSVRYFVTLPGALQQLNQADGGRGRFAESLALGLVQADAALVPVADAPDDQRFLRVVEFSGARPRAMFARRVIPAPPGAAGDTDALARMAAADFDPATDAIAHTDARMPGMEPPAGTEPQTVRFIRDVPAEAEMAVETPVDALLVRTTKHDADWIVRIDGDPAELLRVDFIFQGVVVPAGSHTVEFEYRPDRTPLVLAGAGRLAWLGVWIVWLAGRKRSAETPPA